MSNKIYTIKHETLVEIAEIIKQSHPYNKNISFQEIVNEIDNLGKIKEEYLKFLGNEPKSNKIIIPKGITSVLIPTTNFTVEEIEWQDLEESEITLQSGAFTKTKIVYLEIPKNVTAFDGPIATSVSTLKELVWESSTSIPANAFQYCGLEKVQILGEIEEIGNSAFSGCKVKTFILNLEKFKTWGSNVFGNSTTMEKILFVNGLKNLSTWAMLSVTISGSTRKVAIEENFDLVMDKPAHTYIGNSPFFNCGNIQKAQLDYVENIGTSAFKGSSLTELNAPNLKKIEAYAFGSTALKKINAPKLEELGDQAFYQSTFSCDLYLPSLTKLGANCFENATIEEGFIFNAPNIKELGNKCFYNASFPNLENNFENVEKIGTYCCEWAGDLIFPKLTTLANGSFQYKSNITSFNAPILETIPSQCFNGCTKLKTLYLPMVKTVNSNAFTNCTFEEIDLPSLTVLNKYAFQYCDELTVIHAQNLNIIKSEACYYGSVNLVFLEAPNLEEIQYRGLYHSKCKGNEYLGVDEEGNSKYRFNLPQINIIGEYAFSSYAEIIILGSAERAVPYNIFSTSSPFGNAPGVKELTIYYNGQDENLLNEEGVIDPKMMPYYPWGLGETLINFIPV